MSTYTVEYTDTFAGEANYSWVKRATIHVPERCAEREIMRKAKASMGLTGVRGVKHSMGGMIEFRPYGAATVLFITFKD